jgi:hypothetical protein
MFRKSSSKSKKFRKTKRNTKRTGKINRITKKRTHRGGFTWLENWNLQKYADDSEVQQKLASHFNEPMLIGNPAETLSLLKGMNSNYKSITDLFKEIGVGIQSKEEKEKLMMSNTSLKKYQEQSASKEERKREEREREHEREREEEQAKERERQKRASDLGIQRAKERERERKQMEEAQRAYDEKNKGTIFQTRGVGSSSRGSYGDRRQ